MKELQNQINVAAANRPVLAIIGGAGPDAAIDLQIKLSFMMKSKLDINFDQEHYRVIIDNNSTLFNRDEALLLNGPSPLSSYIDSAKKLEKMGGNILMISCNAAHTYFNDIRKSTTMKIINMIEETASFFYENYVNIKKVGLLSTSATLNEALYHKAFYKYKIEVVPPKVTQQENIMQAIYGIKAGFIDDKQPLEDYEKSKLYNIYKYISNIRSIEDVKHPKTLLLDAIKDFEKQGIEAIILGCTEIPLALSNKDYYGACALIDPTAILASAAIDYAIDIETKRKPNNIQP